MSTIVSETRTPLERAIRHDRAAAALALAAITLLAWAYLARMATGMNGMGSMDMTAAQMQAMGMADVRVWSMADWLALFVMWSVMMIAMMLPSAAPVILIVLKVYRRRGDGRARTSAATFVIGYLLAWTSFSGVAAGAQVALHRASLLTDAMATRSTVVAGVILLAAGAYQWLPVKQACLSHCQSPLGFLTSHWREGSHGALLMGLEHGSFCIGCCWALMALLFAVGVMNLLWVAAIAAFVLLEKVTPQRVPIGRAAGALLMVWGVFELTRGFGA